MSDNTNNQLAKSWQQVFDASQDAINWIEKERGSIRRLNNEADSLIHEFRRLRNTSKRLSVISTRPIAAGFFGLSQSGKSHLISALAADAQGNLETVFNNQKLDFIKHINPPGGGKEATGLVTRFTRSETSSVPEFPLELRLFQEIEIVKILLNAYQNDFDKERVSYQLEQTRINEITKSLSSLINKELIAGINPDDVVALQDYAQDNFAKSLSTLQADYWTKATSLAPYLSIDNRATLFSILWGEITEITALYKQLAKTLAKLHNPERVFAPLSAMVKDNGTGGLTQADSIMIVDMLERLGTELDKNIEVRPLTYDNTIADPVSISTAELTALTAEFVFPLLNQTRVPAVEKLDLLDFPGYRGRLSITSLAEVKEGNPISQLLLRGKVAYLFERYTDSQEMNILIVCTASNKQSDINSVGPALESWIHKTQGETPEQRALRKPGLLWALTMFDIRISDNLNHGEDILKILWGQGGLLKQTILDRFGHYDWLKNWSNDKPFDNVFLVRKPGFKVAWLDMDDSKELAIAQHEASQLTLLRKTFTNDPDIQTHVAKPDETWDAMLKLNDGGMQRISDYLEQVALPTVKAQRLTEQLNQAINHIIENRLGSWYQSEGDEEVLKKRQLANNIIKQLRINRMWVGELMRTLQLPEETLRSLYFSDYDDILSDSANQSNDSNELFDDDLDFFSDTPIPLTPIHDTPQKEANSPFAQAVFQSWVEYLRNLSLDKRLIQSLGFSAQTIEDLINELITGANRLELPNKLAQIALHNERAGSKRDQLAERQVFSMNTEIADFIAWFGFTGPVTEDTPKSMLNEGNAIFEHKEPETVNGLPKLDDSTANYTEIYLFDCYVALARFIESNAGHSAGREINPVQNAKLGEVLRAFDKSKIQ